MGRVGRVKTPRMITTALLALALTLGACADEGSELDEAGDAAPTSTTDTTVVDEGQPLELSAELTGAAERPDPGDPDGRGTAMVVIDPVVNELCFKLTAEDIEEPTAAHIHRGGPEEAGPPVVEITAPSQGSSEGCTAVEESVLNEISTGAANFYVNVHNAEFPQGAIRGQLAVS